MTNNNAARSYREGTIVTTQEYKEYEEQRKQTLDSSLTPIKHQGMPQEEFESLELADMHVELLKSIHALTLGVENLVQLKAQVVELESKKLLMAKEPPLTIVLDSTTED